MSELIRPDADQQRFRDSLFEHPCAPCFNFTSTDMLTPQRLRQVKDFERQSQTEAFWAPGRPPEWLRSFVEQAFRSVPFYRDSGRVPARFETIPPFGREVLRDEPWRLVPDHLSLEALTVYTTSGTSGSALAIPTHPNVSSMLLVLLEKLLAPHGITLPRGEGQVAIALLACQQKTLTYASLSHTLDGAGFLKLNLAPHEWRQPEHRAEYLRQAAPAVLTGSPYAFQVLSEIAPDLRPKALVSSAVALHPGHAARLSQVFACPVFDLYSMTEARAIAGRANGEEDFRLLSADLYVEILGPDDEPLPEGEVGEIVLTGGRNPYFPLVRYQTGDRAALVTTGGQPYLRSFEGRSETYLAGASGRRILTLDVVHALRELAVVGFALEQAADASVSFHYAGEPAEKSVQQPLEELFGGAVKVSKALVWEGKPHRFSSALAAPPE